MRLLVHTANEYTRFVFLANFDREPLNLVLKAYGYAIRRIGFDHPVHYEDARDSPLPYLIDRVEL